MPVGVIFSRFKPCLFLYKLDIQYLEMIHCPTWTIPSLVSFKDVGTLHPDLKACSHHLKPRFERCIRAEDPKTKAASIDGHWGVWGESMNLSFVVGANSGYLTVRFGGIRSFCFWLVLMCCKVILLLFTVVYCSYIKFQVGTRQ